MKNTRPKGILWKYLIGPPPHNTTHVRLFNIYLQSSYDNLRARFMFMTWFANAPGKSNKAPKMSLMPTKFPPPVILRIDCEWCQGVRKIDLKIVKLESFQGLTNAVRTKAMHNLLKSFLYPAWQNFICYGRVNMLRHTLGWRWGCGGEGMKTYESDTINPRGHRTQ